MNSKVREHNQEVRYSAEYRARKMRIFPSPLEERMQRLLDEHYIQYECQKIFYIHADDGWIVRYYIADFYVPSAQLIIEVDGKFHDRQKQHDKVRTKTIQEQYPDVKVVRLSWEDMSDDDKMNDLLMML